MWMKKQEQEINFPTLKFLEQIPTVTVMEDLIYDDKEQQFKATAFYHDKKQIYAQVLVIREMNINWLISMWRK